MAPLLLIVLSTVPVASTAVASAETTAVSAVGWGSLYLYGVSVSSPYVFTGFGTDTLRVNDIALIPPWSRPSGFVADWRDSLSTAAWEAYCQAGGATDGLAAAVSVYSRDSRATVQSVDGMTLLVHLDGEDGPLRHEFPPLAPPIDGSVIRDRLGADQRAFVARLIHSLAAGKLFARGSHYEVILDRDHASDLTPFLEEGLGWPDSAIPLGDDRMLRRLRDDVLEARESGGFAVH